MTEKQVERHIKALKKLFPDSMVRDGEEWNGEPGFIWTGFGEDGTSSYHRAGWPDEHNSKLRKYMDENGLYGEWWDAGTLMIYSI